jgi:hypothetical protein
MSESKREILNQSFNEEFCAKLEHHLTRTFGKSELRGFWCDGVSMPTHDLELTKKYVNDKRRIVTKAWLGFNGQDVYEMIINLGQYSLRRYAKGSDLIDCLPSEDSTDWIELDVESKTIKVQLK